MFIGSNKSEHNECGLVAILKLVETESDGSFKNKAVKFKVLSTYFLSYMIRDWVQHRCLLEELLSNLIPWAHHAIQQSRSYHGIMSLLEISLMDKIHMI